MTGLYNRNGMEIQYYALLSEQKTLNVQLTMLKVCLFVDELNTIVSKTSAISEVAEVVRLFCRSEGICGRISEDTFLCMTYPMNC